MKIVSSYEELEETVRNALAESEQSIREVARQTDISKSHLSNFKNGERNISFPHLTKLADFFQIRYKLKNY